MKEDKDDSSQMIRIEGRRTNIEGDFWAEDFGEVVGCIVCYYVGSLEWGGNDENSRDEYGKRGVPGIV